MTRTRHARCFPSRIPARPVWPPGLPGRSPSWLPSALYRTSPPSSFCRLCVVAPRPPACTVKAGTVGSDSSGAEDVSETEANVEVLGASFVGSDGQSVATASFAGNSDVKLLVDGSGEPRFSVSSGRLRDGVDRRGGHAGDIHLRRLHRTPRPRPPAGHDHGPLAGRALPTLTLEFSVAQNFTAINGATIASWQATAVVTANGAARAMTWNAQLAGTTASGRTFQRTNQKDLSWTVGQACLAVSGQSNGTITGAHLQTTITNYQRCLGRLSASRQRDRGQEPRRRGFDRHRLRRRPRSGPDDQRQVGDDRAPLRRLTR